MYQDKIDFMKEMETIDKRGNLHKAKMAGFIYELVEKKVTALKTELMRLGGDSNEFSQLNQVGENLRELSKNILEVQDSVSLLDNKINSLEQRFNEFENKNKKIKIRKD